jgi:hypothetical protein
METTKLTVRVPRPLVEGAKRYAYEHSTTLTHLIAEFLRQLDIASDPLADAPIVQRLSGVLPEETSIDDYHHYLEEKYLDEGAN